MIVENTSAYFISSNPIIKYGSYAVCTDTKKVKFGDGSTAYNSIAYSGFLWNNNQLIVDTTNGAGGLVELTLVSGAIDGVNTVFVWSNPPLLVFWGGQLLREGTGYTLAGSTTTFTNPPFTGDDVWAYENTTGVVFSALTLVSGAIDGVNDTFVWSSPPLEVFVEGQLKVDTVGYNLSGNTIIFTAGNIPFSGDNLNAFGNV